MSVVHQSSPGWLVDHLSFINKINYELHQPPEPCRSQKEPPSGSFASLQMDTRPCAVSGSTREPEKQSGPSCGMFTWKYAFRSDLFNVAKPYITSECQPSNDLMNGVQKEKSSSITGKKRKRCVDFNQGELDAMEYHTKIREWILDGSLQLIQEGLRSGFLYPGFDRWEKCRESIVLPRDTCNLSGLCEMAKCFPSVNEMELQTLQLTEDDVCVTEQDLFSRVVENSSSFPKMITLMGQKYLLPPRSSFLLSDISCMEPLLNWNLRIITIQPVSCGHLQVDCEQITTGKKTFDVIVIDPPWQNKSVKRSKRYSYLSPLQIKQIPIAKLASPNCLVVTWVTNRQKHLRFVKEELYPSWAVEVLAEWHWVKITNSGEFVFPLDSPHKKPYEGIILGRVQGKTTSPFRNADVRVPPVPDRKLIVSVPCVLHSHKPPLAEVLQDYVKPEGQCLELFARSLQPGWMSWGNEVLKFQHVDYFINLESGCQL